MFHSFLPLHSDCVSLLFANFILLSMLWSQLPLLAWRMVYPIMIIQDILMVHSNELILYGTTQNLALPQSITSQRVLGCKKTMDTPNIRIRTTSFGKCMICEIIQMFWPYLPRTPNSEDTPILEAEIQLC